MSDIPFTQFLMPDGRPVQRTIDRPDKISALAHAIIAKGYRFECEMLPAGDVSFTITDEDQDHEIEICQNGPDVPVRIDAMIERFADKIGVA
jgi:hypothetical protein